MPLLGNGEYREPMAFEDSATEAKSTRRRQSQHSIIAKNAIMSHFSTPSTDGARTPEDAEIVKEKAHKSYGIPVFENNLGVEPHANGVKQGAADGTALTDTPMTTAPNSPEMSVFPMLLWKVLLHWYSIPSKTPHSPVMYVFVAMFIPQPRTAADL